MKLSIVKGATSQIVLVFIQDSSSTTGAGLSGLTSATSGLICYRARTDDGNAGGTQITLSAGTRGTFSSGGFVEKDSTNLKGWYELGIPNTAIATGSRFVGISLSGATNMAPCNLEIELTGWDNQDAVHGGLSAIPNATAGAANGLQICGSNAATTFASLTCTGNFAISDGITITRSTSGQDGVTITGNASGNGITITGGSNGNGMKLVAGGSAGDGLNISATVGHGMNVSCNGTNKHGALFSGGSSSTSDGVKCVAGNSGVGLRVDSLTCTNNAAVGGTWTTTGTTTLTGAVSLGSTLGVTGATTFTGNVGMAAGLSITQSSSNTAALLVTGNGTGNGATFTSGSGLTGVGLSIVAASTNGAGLNLAGKGTGGGLLSTGGLTGSGFQIVGGGTSGDGIKVTTTSGHGVNLAPVGASKHGFFSTGGNGGTSDGMSLVAGTGGVDLRANQTGNLVGTVSTLTTYTGNTPQTGDSFALIGTAGAGLTNLGDTRIANLDAAVSSRMATFGLPTNFASLGITAAGKISEVVLVDTTTTNTDMRGTDTAALASVWTPTIAGHINTDLSTLATTVDLATANAALVKLLAACYDTCTVSGNVITMSNTHTQTIDASGNRTTA